MRFHHLITLLPCYSLDDFPVYATGDEADGLLTAWTTAWHPALIAHAERMPTWCRMDDLPVDTQDAILFVPGGKDYAYGLPDVVSRAVADARCVLIADKTSRQESLKATFAAVDLQNNSGWQMSGDTDSATSESSSNVQLHLAADFMALGYCYLQVELLTRQMRYSTSVDVQRFGSILVQSAKDWQDEKQDAARQGLTDCFNLLAQERDHYYPVDAFLIDLTLTADSTTPDALLEAIHEGTPTSLWLTSRRLEQLADASDEVVATMQRAIADDRICVYGGEVDEHPLPNMSLEHILAELTAANAGFTERLDVVPKIFGRRRFGMTLRLPQILTRLGYQGVVHPTLDEGRFPEGGQPRVRWTGLDGTPIDALAGIPRDAALPETFLRLALRMGQSMESDFVAAVSLAHWAGNASPWYDDLRRSARYGVALGRFVTLDTFFAETTSSGQPDEFPYDRYMSPFLTQSIANNEPHPIARWPRYWHHQSTLNAIQSIQAWIQMLAPLGRTTRVATATVERPVTDHFAPTPQQIDAAHSELKRLAADLADLVMAHPSGTEQAPATAIDAPIGAVTVNPFSVPRRTRVPIQTAQEEPVYASELVDGVGQSLVDTPAHGFAWVPPRTEPSIGSSSKGGSRPADFDQIASLSQTETGTRNVLRNEFCEVRIDPTTGSVTGLFDFHSRGNRLSQQLAMRRAGPSSPSSQPAQRASAEPEYSVMRADRCEIVENSRLVGTVQSTGSLVDVDGTAVAGYQQITRLRRGSRLVELEITIDPHQFPGDDPWNAYFASRVAWANEAALVYRDVGQSRQPTTATRIESPLFVEIDDISRRTAILTGGLTYHRRVQRRFLDTILVTQGEEETQFRLAIGVDCRSIVADAWSYLTPDVVVEHATPQTAGRSWLFHINARNVIATHWSARMEGNSDRPDSDRPDFQSDDEGDPTHRKRCIGCTVRLLETVGRGGEITLQSFRPIKSARRQNFLGAENYECKVVDGAARIEIGAHEWTQIELDW